MWFLDFNTFLKVFLYDILLLHKKDFFKQSSKIFPSFQNELITGRPKIGGKYQ